MRSGILDSIHAFGASTVGIPFLVLIVVMLGGSIGLVAWRAPALRSEHGLDSLLSREAMFVLNNLVLVGLAFVVFWGTFFPLISEALTGNRSSVGPPWFDRYTVPLALALVLLSGLGPALAWRRTTARNLRHRLALPGLAGAAALAVGLVAGGGHVTAALMFGCAAFVVTVTAQELWRGTSARRAATREPRARAALELVRRNRRRYGGYIVHIGMALLFVGVAASSSFQDVYDGRLRPGQSFRAGDYDITYVRATAAVDDDPRATGAIMTLGAVLDVERDGEHVATLRPTRGYFPVPDASRGLGLTADRGRADERGRAACRAAPRPVGGGHARHRVPRSAPRARRPAHPGRARRPRADDARADRALLRTARSRPRSSASSSSPMVTWIWLGALTVLAGALFALVPRRRRVRVPASDPRRDALEAAREAKYREIRDAELDLHTGKLATPDFAAVDGRLREEAVEILRELDRV